MTDTVVLCLHGIESHSGWFSDLASELILRNIDVSTYDRPGSGIEATRWTLADDSAEAHVDAFKNHLSGLRKQYKKVMVIGMSWGGLLAAYAVSRPLSDEVAPDFTILLVPGLFSRKKLSALTTLSAAVSFLRRKPELFKLPLSVQDFSDDPQVQRRITADPLRRTAVSSHLLFTTLRMRRTVAKSRFPAGKIAILLAESDRIVDNEATHRFADSKGIEVRIVQARSHCLVLESPKEIADLVASLTPRREDL